MAKRKSLLDAAKQLPKGKCGPRSYLDTIDQKLRPEVEDLLRWYKTQPMGDRVSMKEIRELLKEHVGRAPCEQSLRDMIQAVK